MEKSGINMRAIKNEENKLEISLKVRDIQDKLGVKNMCDLTIKEIEGIYNKKRKNITRQEKEKYKAWADDGFVYIPSDLALKIKMDCKIPTATDFKSKLEFNQHDIIMTKEQLVLKKIIKVFVKEKILVQHSVLKYRIDLYFPDHKLAIKVDERGHKDREDKEEDKEDKEEEKK